MRRFILQVAFLLLATLGELNGVMCAQPVTSSGFRSTTSGSASLSSLFHDLTLTLTLTTQLHCLPSPLTVAVRSQKTALPFTSPTPLPPPVPLNPRHTWRVRNGDNNTCVLMAARLEMLVTYTRTNGTNRTVS